MHAAALWVLAAFLVLAWRPVAAQVPEPAGDRVIEAINGGLHRARDGARSTVFLVTTEGIVLADPLNPDFARWLDAEFQKRFPDRPVRYVIYTTEDFDRAGGAASFDDTAELVAAEGFNQRIGEQRATLPSRFAALDRNASGVLESGELDASAAAEPIRRRDRNGDGHVTGNEFWNDVVNAERTYRGRLTITLGEARVDVIRPGRTDGPDMGLVYFPAQRVLFAGTHPSLTAFADDGLQPADMAAWAAAVAPLGFDTLETGANTSVPHADVAILTRYIEELLGGVATGYERGRTLDDLQRSPLLEGFRGTAVAATRDADISFVYRNSRLLAGEAYGAGALNLSWTSVCIRNARDGSCIPDTFEPRIAGGLAGVAISLRRARAAAEVHVSQQFNAAVPIAGTPAQIGHRDTVVSFPGGPRLIAPGGLDVTLLFGPSIAFTKQVIAGPARTRGPTSAPIVFVRSAWRFGVTMGGDVRVPLAGRMSLLLPVRMTWLRGQEFDYDGFVGARDLRFGAGVTVRLFRIAG